MMNRLSLYAAAVLTMGFAGGLANAAVVYFDPFNVEPGVTAGNLGLNVTPQGWTILSGGTVDTIPSVNTFGITCDGTHYCIDTDGSTGQAGELVTAANGTGGTVTLLGGHTYQLSAEISGNQRNGSSDNLQFGFLNKTNTVLDQSPVYSIPGSSGFNLYKLTFMPSSTEAVKLFFFNVGGNDNQGPILDTVTLRSVPLPASAWLLLSALAGVGLIGRRRLTV
jgi:hypothetical protein